MDLTDLVDDDFYDGLSPLRVGGEPLDLETVLDITDSLPFRFMKDLAKNAGCFRTEIRDTGKHICGVHSNGDYWASAADLCPEIILIGDQLSATLWEVLS